MVHGIASGGKHWVHSFFTFIQTPYPPSLHLNFCSLPGTQELWPDFFMLLHGVQDTLELLSGLSACTTPWAVGHLLLCPPCSMWGFHRGCSAGVCLECKAQVPFLRPSQPPKVFTVLLPQGYYPMWGGWNLLYSQFIQSFQGNFFCHCAQEELLFCILLIELILMTSIFQSSKPWCLEFLRHAFSFSTMPFSWKWKVLGFQINVLTKEFEMIFWNSKLNDHCFVPDYIHLSPEDST